MIVNESDTEICSGDIVLDDYGDYGTIIVKRNGVTIDCNGASINGGGRGVGIMLVRSKGVTIQNCKISGFEYGIKGNESNNVSLINNWLCGNSRGDIELPDTSQMTGRNNKCRTPGTWHDQGKQGCTQKLITCNEIRRQAPAGVQRNIKGLKKMLFR